MFKMKKVLCVVLAVALAAGLMMTGCGKGNESTAAQDTSSTEAVQATTEAAPKLEPYEVNWYIVGPGQPKDTPMVEEAANEYLADKINTTLKFHVLDWGTWGTKIGTMIAASEYMDIVYTAEWFGYADNVAKNAFLPLNDLIDQYAPKTKELLGEAFIKGSQVDGINYALPVKKECADNHGLVFNKALLDKYQFDISTIKSIEDIEPWLKTIKENEKDITPVGNGLVGTVQFNFLAGDSAIPGALYIDNRDTKVINQWETPEMNKALQTVRKYYLAGYVQKDAATQNNKYNDLLKNGLLFCAYEPLKPGKDAELSNDKVTYVQKELGLTTTGTGNTAGSMQAISRTSKNPERAMMFLELVNTDKYLNNLLNYGIEGTHYKKVSDNVIDPIPDNGWNLNMQWAVGNQFLNYLKSNEDPRKWEKYEEFNMSAISKVTLGFRFNKEPYQAELAAIMNVGAEFKEALSVGSIDPDKALPQFIQKQKMAGSEKIMAAIQQQLDEWLAKTKK